VRDDFAVGENGFIWLALAIPALAPIGWQPASLQTGPDQHL
jgi:hypothetical protein